MENAGNDLIELITLFGTVGLMILIYLLIDRLIKKAKIRKDALILKRKPIQLKTNSTKTSRKINGKIIHIETWDGEKGFSLSLTLNISILESKEFNISNETWPAAILQGISGNQITIGDPLFDKNFNITGDKDSVVSLLRQTLRQPILDTLQVTYAINIQHNSIRLNAYRDYKGSEKAIDELSNVLLRIFYQIDSARSLTQRCLDNVRNDPVPEVRYNNLEILARRFPQHADTKAAVSWALGDKSPKNRLLAKIQLGLEGLDKIRIHLRKHLLSTEVLNLILQYSDRETLIQLIPDLENAFWRSDSRNHKVAIIERLKETRSATVSPFLFNIQEREKDSGILVCAARALGFCAVEDDIEKIFILAQKSSSISLKKALNDAKTLLQERFIPQGERGALSLDESSEKQGGLSIDALQSGGLSISEED